MAYSVAANYASAMLTQLKDIANGNAPSLKITPVGFLRALAEHNSAAKIIEQGYMKDGHIRDVRVAYQQRGIESNVDDTDDCDIDVIPSYNEFTTSMSMFSKLSIYIDDKTIGRYVSDASSSVKVGQPSTLLMKEHLDTIIQQANAVFQKANRNLLTKVAANIGVNIATGNNSAKSINIPIDITEQPLNTGISEVLDDFDNNEFSGKPIIITAGIFNKYQRRLQGSGLNMGGIDITKFDNDYEYYLDQISQQVLGTNQALVLADGSVYFIGDYNRYVGDFAGDKLISFNFTMQLPVVESVTGKSLSFFKVDAKLMRIACPTTVDVGPYGVPTEVNEGWQLILSKYYDLVQQPSDAYAASDRLYGNNGTLRYLFTNS